jgi:EpsD family peptidyl-prolyl cis-trans isomerase
MRSAKLFFPLLVIVLSVGVAACGKKEEAGAKNGDTQVVAKVNGDEITIHQVNFLLSRMGPMNEAQGKVAAKQVLSNLVELQLLKQKAIEAKLDKDPNVLQALESQKDQFLAQAYLQKQMTSAPKPSASEIDDFYNSHPELFAQRRVFRLQELIVAIKKEQYAETEAALKPIKSISGVAAFLKEKNYLFTLNSNVKSAEQLPMELLKKLQPLKDDEVMVVPTDKSFNIVHIAASKTEPVTRDKAKPVIEQYFLNQNKSTLAQKEVAALNEKAKIEFVGAFKDMKKSDLIKPNASAPMVEAEAKPETEQTNQAAVQKADKPKTNPSSIEKGLSGL